MTILIFALTAFSGHYQVAPTIVGVEAFCSHFHCGLAILEREADLVCTTQRIEKAKYIGSDQFNRQRLPGV